MHLPRKTSITCLNRRANLAHSLRVERPHSALFYATQNIPATTVGAWVQIYNTTATTRTRQSAEDGIDAEDLKAKLSLKRTRLFETLPVDPPPPPPPRRKTSPGRPATGRQPTLSGSIELHSRHKCSRLLRIAFQRPNGKPCATLHDKCELWQQQLPASLECSRKKRISCPQFPDWSIFCSTRQQTV